MHIFASGEFGCTNPVITREVIWNFESLPSSTDTKPYAVVENEKFPMGL